MKLVIQTVFATVFSLLLVSSSGKADLTLDAAEPTANGSYQISANWSELKRGWNQLVFQLTDANQQLVSGAIVTIKYNMIGMNMDPPDNPVVETQSGVYEKKIFLGMNGNWKFDSRVIKQSVEDTHSKTQGVLKW